MARRKKKKQQPSSRVCDPAVCDCCQYIGDGDFLCDKHMEIVMSDWEPTENYLMCRGDNRG